MEFRILGTLEAVDDAGGPIELGGSQPRALVAVLVAAAGRGLTTDALIDAIWGEQAPPSAAGTLQSYVSRLRSAFQRAGAGSVLVRESNGYRLAVEAEQVDFRRFELLADRGRTLAEQGRLEEARDALVAAERLWRGPALAEFADRDFARGLAARLEERRVSALEDRLSADLALGRAGSVVGELTEIVRRHPLRETLRGHLALALYRAGRQADALRALDETRTVLRDELGVDPSPPLRDLERRILAQDPTLLPAGAGAPAAPAPAPQPFTPSARTGRAGGPTGAAGAAGAWPLVGRRAELAQLTRVLDEATAGARFALVEGEPGVGKTRLVEEVAAEAAGRGQLVVWGRCHEGGGSPAFWPWLAALRSLIEFSPALAPGDDPALSVLVAPQRDGDAHLGGQSRFQLFDAVASALTRAAADRPLLVVLDDLQWADQASLELLAFLAGRLTGDQVVVLGTMRQLEVGRRDVLVDTLATLARTPRSVRMQLAGLDAAATHQLVNESCSRSVPRVVAQAIHERAEGNAFYATELARLLVIDDGASDELLQTPLDVPAGVRDVIRQRLARLPDSAVQLLRVGAVIGRDLPLGLLTEAAGRLADEVLDDLDVALVHRVLVEAPDRMAVFRFTHALVREVLLEDMSPLRRARLHLRVADAIAAAGSDDDTAEILAEHLWAAAPIGVGMRAAEALERAADVAIRRLAVDAADHLLERALELRRVSGGAQGVEAELATLTRLTGVRRALRGYAAVVDLSVRGQELARRLGLASLVREHRFAEWSGADTANDFARARPIAQEFLADAERSDDVRTQILGFHVWGIQCWHDGRIDESVSYLDRAADLATAYPWEADPLGMDYEHQVVAAAFRIHCHELVGDLDDPEAAFTAHAARQPDRFALSLVWGFAAAGAAALGDVERTHRAVQRGMAADPDVMFTFYGCGMQMALGGVEVALGRVDEGTARFDAGRQRLLEQGTRTTQCAYLAAMASALVAQGRLDLAARYVGHARTEQDTFGERWALPLVMLAEAQLARASGGPAGEVERRFREAEAEALRQGAGGIAERIAREAARP